jgi:cytochrome oxidase assembly protein ShyY1
MLKTKKLIALGVGAAAILALERSRQTIHAEKKDLAKIAANSAQPLVTLKSQQLVNYPWTRDFSTGEKAEDWEFRKVKIRGSLFGHCHLVYRERNGEPGYLVFKGLKTANGMRPELVNTGLFESPPVGIMVKLGWISARNAHNLQEQEVNFITKVEHDTSLPVLFPQIRNPTTGFVYNSEGDDLEYPIENMDEEEVDITGFLRKGETQNFLTGRRRFHTQLTTTFVDLDRMAAFYNFRNVYAATRYYLEAAVEDPQGTMEIENKIVPANLDQPLASSKAETDVSTKKTLRNAEVVTGVLTGLGLYFL